MSAKSPVIVGVGLTPESSYVLKKVVGLVGDPNRIIAVHVLERNPLAYLDDTAAASDLLIRVEADALRQLQEVCQPFGITQVQVVEGHPAAALHALSDETNAQVVAVGSHGLRGWRALLGETATAVLHNTHNNVLAVLTKDQVSEPDLAYRKILVAVDMSDEVDEIVAEACRVRERYDGEITLVSVIKPLSTLSNPMVEPSTVSIYESFIQQAGDQYRDQLAELARRFEIENQVIINGHPASEIQNTAEDIDADLIVLGTHGTHGPALLLGSTANAVLHGMTCDVLAVRVGLKSSA